MRKFRLAIDQSKFCTKTVVSLFLQNLYLARFSFFLSELTKFSALELCYVIR